MTYQPPRGRNVSRFRRTRSGVTGARPSADDGDEDNDCRHLGRRVHVAGSTRDWRACAKGIDQGEGPGVVCPCKGCGAKCPRYASGNPDDGD